MAGTLGWPPGVIPGAEVTIEQAGSGASRQMAAADSNGQVRFSGLLAGVYEVSFVRLLTPDDQARLDSAFAGVTAFGGGQLINVAPPRVEAQVRGVAGRRESALLSELAFAQLFIAATGSDYFGSTFLELYNNGDTTVYLDGKLIAAGWDFAVDAPTFPCDSSAPFRTDSLGIWARWIYRFPGGGRDYPLAPGQNVVIATVAIDHREFVEGGVDLSNADFEFEGGVDNPVVPNLVSVGPSPHPLGLGLIFHSLRQVPVLAEGVDVSQLPEARAFASGQVFVRIPREAVIAVAAFSAAVDGGTPECTPMVHPVFDRQRGRFVRGYDTRSIHRRLLGRLPGGQALLQHTRTSAQDFFAADKTPGWVP